MSRLINFTLTKDELATVETAMHHAPQPEVRQRATAIRMLHLGHKPETVAELLAVAPSTVWNWHRRYRAEGVPGLANQPKSGRPAKADDAYVQAIETAVEADPRTLGYAFSVWTLNKLRLHLAKITGLLLSYSRFREVVRRHNYVYRQPKHDLSGLQDEQAKATTEALLEWLKKSPTTTTPTSSSLWTKRV